MSNLLPPVPVGVPASHSFWNDWYNKMRDSVNSFSTGFPFSSITGKPTTISGYGITDAPTLDGVNRINVGVDTTDFIVLDSLTTGVVIRSPNGSYWQINVSNAGVLSTTALGGKP